mmetsp:Transcript_14327/g.45058  ORF Transcript_14327/g.45058 Transcript_14327/m.45058 type:complete len:109 (-) Transcript_14327:44-370(-)
MDEYEGVSKGYYARVAVDCTVVGPENVQDCSVVSPENVQGQMYGVADSKQLWSEEELQSLDCIPEYTQEMHDALYRPVEHIGLKQQLYLSSCPRYNATDAHEAPRSRS